MTRKAIAVLGSTGSIGRSTLDVALAHPGRFRVVSLAAGQNIDLLTEQVKTHAPELVSVARAEDRDRLLERFPGLEVVDGATGLVDVATHPDVDVVVAGLVGAVGLESCHAALAAGTTLALANKEALVMAGEAMLAAAATSGARILPVDSEHNAIHQALRGGQRDEVERIILTASGGPFLDRDLVTFHDITVAEALAHPTWKMGPKISIDSATMMNKGLEIIEAHFLFGLPGERIDAIVHPQSIVHSMVEFKDASILAQLSVSDMRLPILYALAWPERPLSPLPRLDLAELGRLEFQSLDPERFPAVGLARVALAAGGSAPGVLNAGNEVAVAAFLAGEISFVQISAQLARLLEVHLGEHGGCQTLEEAVHWDGWARARMTEMLEAQR